MQNWFICILLLLWWLHLWKKLISSFWFCPKNSRAWQSSMLITVRKNKKKPSRAQMHHDLFGHVQTWSRKYFKFCWRPCQCSLYQRVCSPWNVYNVTCNPVSYLPALLLMCLCKLFIVYFQRKNTEGTNHRGAHEAFGKSAWLILYNLLINTQAILISFPSLSSWVNFQTVMFCLVWLKLSPLKRPHSPGAIS